MSDSHTHQLFEGGRRRLINIASDKWARGMQSTVDHMQSCSPMSELKILDL